MKPVERNPFLPLLAFALLVLLSVLSFMGYLLAARRLQAPPPAEVLTVLTPEGPHTLRGRVARTPEGCRAHAVQVCAHLIFGLPAQTPEAWRRGLGLREEGLEALLYLFPEATDAPFSAEGYRFPVVVAFLDGTLRVLQVKRLSPGEVYAPGTAYRGVLEVREGLLSLAPGDQVVPWAPPTRTGPPKSSPRQPGEGNGEKGD